MPPKKSMVVPEGNGPIPQKCVRDDTWNQYTGEPPSNNV